MMPSHVPGNVLFHNFAAGVHIPKIVPTVIVLTIKFVEARSHKKIT